MMNFSRLEQFIQERMQAAQVPGVALALVQGGELIYSRGLGVTSVEERGINYVVINNGPCQRILYNPSFTLTTEILQRYSGVFTRAERFGTSFDQLTFRVEQEKLFVHSQAEQAEFLCTAVSDTRFAWRQGQIDFLLNEDGTVTKLLVAATELYERQA